MRRLSTLALLILSLSVMSYLVTHYLQSRKSVSTDNAYISGSITTVSSQLDDIVMWVGADAGDFVTAGQVVVRLDGGTPKNKLDRAKSELAATVQQVAALKQRVQRQQAEVRQAQASYELARNEAQRRNKLAARGMVSKEERDIAVLRQREAQAALETAQQILAEATINAGHMPIAEHPKVQGAAALVRGIFAEVNKGAIVAPVSGHIAKSFVSVGDTIKTGQPLLQLVQLDQTWVEANFKETQLHSLHLGQPVEIISDLYGDDVVYNGEVIGTGTGTGSAFALLPAQNATGNWLKIVQRVPVRIVFTGEQIRDHPLPIGTSLAVKIDTTSQDGPRLSTTPATHSSDVSSVYKYWRAGARDLVEAIINDNLPTTQVDGQPEQVVAKRLSADQLAADQLAAKQ